MLSSVSEGLPLALLEYGAARLAAVATAVGQCPEVLDGGSAGLLVPPRSPDLLAQALIALLKSPDKRRELGDRFYERVQALYSTEAVIGRICDVYQAVLENRVIPRTRVTCQGSE